MPRRQSLACLALILATGTASAQVPFLRDAIPTRPALARVGLDLQWVGVAPLLGPEKLARVSIDAGMLFAQTNSGNFHAFDAETGRLLWTAHIGSITAHSQPASVNSTTVFVTNSNKLFALDRRTGRQVWSRELTDTPTSATTCNEDYVLVGTESGKLEAFLTKNGAIHWNIQANATISSRPVLAGKLVAFASEDHKVYLSRTEKAKLYWRFASAAPILAPLASHGVRTLLVASTDHTLTAIDLFTGVGQWTFPTGSPVVQEPVVVGDDAYVINNQGMLFAVDARTGQSRWSVSTLGGRLISISATKIYLESYDEDLFVVDRQSGKVVHEPSATFYRAGINLREFALGPTNKFDDRLYLGTTTGLIICLREINQPNPLPLRDPKQKPFGYIPPEGYPDLENPDGSPAPAAEPAEADAPR